MSTRSVPVYLRLGSGDAYPVGTVDVPSTSEGTVALVRTELAGVLREVADVLNPPVVGQ